MGKFDRIKEDVSANERRNWPNCKKSAHEFVDYDISPIVNRRMWNNEEVAHLIRLRKNEYLQQKYPNEWPFGITYEQNKAEEAIAKVDILNSIYPNVNLHTFKEDNADLRDKCCRYIFQVSLEQIATSHFVHGDWYDIDLHHVEKIGRFYVPQLNYTTPDPRIAFSGNTQCLNTLLEYLAWRKSDPDKVVLPVIQRLFELNNKVDIAHENTLGA